MSAIECNICFEDAQQPMITQCGHLFWQICNSSWPCIYEWINHNQNFLKCPVCKNGISLKSLVSFYPKSQEEQKSEINIPQRPINKRYKPMINNNCLERNGTTNLQQGITVAGYGIFPSHQKGNTIDDSLQFKYWKYFRLYQLFLLCFLLFICIRFF